MSDMRVEGGEYSSAVAPRVLFVDDSEDERELFPIRFAGRFSRVVAVGSAEEALEVVRAGETDLVFTDITLPDESGLDLVRHMRESAPEIGGDVPAVAVTGLGAADDLDRAFEAGFSGYLVKPYDSADLLSLVDRVSPSVAALRRLRERCAAQRAEQREIRARVVEQRRSAREQRARLALRHGTADERDAARLECVLSAARSFASVHFGRPTDELEVATSRLLEDGVRSWVVVAVCRDALLFIEVIDGPGADFVARRLDA